MSAVETPREPGAPALPLRSLRLLVITSGHEVNDSRVYAREAKSMRALGADVTIVGKLERGTAEGVRTLLVAPAGSRLPSAAGSPADRCPPAGTDGAGPPTG